MKSCFQIIDSSLQRIDLRAKHVIRLLIPRNFILLDWLIGSK